VRLLRLALLLVLVAVAILLAGAWQSLGRHADGALLQRLRQSPQWHQDRFVDAQPMWNDADAFLHIFDSTAGESPNGPVPVHYSDGEALRTPPATGLRVTWFGHSSTLLEIDGLRVLIDPFWSERASPLPWVGPRRWFAPPIALADLPHIDAVLISHDHYDHLDHGTIAAMRDWDTVFVVPLGIGAHLAYWGIAPRRIIELDWWESTRMRGVEIVAMPARHASGRINPQSDVTLWSGFALRGARHRVYYSGDTGLFPAMSDIGRRYGPFDLTLIEAGQYDADWPDWHSGPEQAVEANRRVMGKMMMPVHWGLLKLAHHGWTEPAERVLAAARCQHVALLMPRPGDSVEPELQGLQPRWWPNAPWRSAADQPIVATVDGDPGVRVTPPICSSIR
jgi:L-ascorbate metabolism protein UlaG (beta-lactamase superfamily)